MDRLFTAFNQVDASTTRVYGGTGLGLAITNLLVELMGGRIRVESEVGSGSTFHFTVAAQAATQPEDQALWISPDLRGMRVLIVDDNTTSRHIASEYAHGWGMVPIEAASPLHALRVLREEKAFDLAVIDHRMPEMSGDQLARHLRRRRRRLPIVLLSSLDRRGTKTHEAVPAAILFKPIKPKLLHAAFLKALSLGASGPEEEPPTTVLDTTMAARHPLRVLVAEDNPVNRRVAAAFLDRLGYSADFASNGREAIDALTRQPYDTVLMDVQMPEIDGVQATREICRRWPEGARPRIIAMTASATAEDRRQCLEAGMDDYLIKPVMPQKLIDALGRCSPIDYGPASRSRSSGQHIRLDASGAKSMRELHD
jgi:CheY-like chemotaxis protein